MSDLKLILLVLLVASPQAVFSQTAEEKGLEIAQAADAYDQGFSDFTADMVMTLKSKSGDTSTRLIRIKTLEVSDDGDKSLSIFDEPAINTIEVTSNARPTVLKA